MNKKAVRAAFIEVLTEAGKSQCSNLSHYRSGDFHAYDKRCPVKARLNESIHLLQEYVEDKEGIEL